MPCRLRKLIGTIVMIAFVMVYAVVAMALADSRVSQVPELVRALVYAALGLAWVLPLLPLIRWMERPDADAAGGP
jgi:predicted membrane channel-forming protein YqfA (hemolysin III family)